MNCGKGLDIFMDWKGEKGERRMETREGGMMDVMALVTSRAKRERAGMEPPQESGVYFVSQLCEKDPKKCFFIWFLPVRLFETSCVNWSIRYPFAAWISTPSNPASIAFFAACL